MVESKDFSIALALDTNGVSKIGMDIIGADSVVTTFISSITAQVPFLA